MAHPPALPNYAHNHIYVLCHQNLFWRLLPYSWKFMAEVKGDAWQETHPPLVK